MKRIRFILIIAVVMLSACQKDRVSPRTDITGRYEVVVGDLLPIGQQVLIKERHIYFNHVGIPYTIHRDRIIMLIMEYPMQGYRFRKSDMALLLFRNDSSAGLIIKN